MGGHGDLIGPDSREGTEMKTTIYKTICALLGASVLLLAACDPGVAYPEDETMDWTTESWEQMEGNSESQARGPDGGSLDLRGRGRIRGCG